MNIFLLKRLVRRCLVMNAVEGDGAGGGGVAAPAAPAPAPSAEPAATPAPASPPAPVPSEPAAPTSMLDAITQGLDRPRDSQGRFTQKDPNAPASPPAAIAAVPALAPGVAPAAPPAAAAPPAPAPALAQPEDDLQLPEGLTPGAQQRFQKLANTVREQTQQLEQRDQQIGYVRDTFQQHGIKQEQFEQAAGVIGMMNRGDFAGAQKVLEQQLQQIALITGTPPSAIDALADYPDLRQAVDGMQVTEAHALEIARGRAQRFQAEQHTQRQNQEQQSQQQAQQAVQTATNAVDGFCKRMMASDLDYAAIEAQLLPELSNLLRGLPPATWQNAVETQYRMLKNAASKFKAAAPAPAPATVLRATGQGSPAAAPKTAYEAMWGKPAPTA